MYTYTFTENYDVIPPYINVHKAYATKIVQYIYTNFEQINQY